MQSKCSDCSKMAAFMTVMQNTCIGGDFEHYDKSISIVADDLDIAEVFTYGMRLKNDDCFDRCIYRYSGSDGISNAEMLEKKYRTIENTEIKIVFSKRNADSCWSDIQKEKLSVIAGVIFNFMDRSYLLNIAETSMYRDIKTGFLNIDGYKKTADERIKSAEDDFYNMIFFNIHKFRTINEIYGYTVGNKVIESMGRKVIDFIDDDEIFGRMGGDDFSVLVKKSNTESFLKYISRISIPVKTEKLNDDIEVSLSFYGGIYEINDWHENITEIMEKTRAAFKMSKTENDIGFVYYNEQVQRQISKQKRLEYIMYPALDNNEFVVYYQPKVDLDTYNLIGAEALVRWYNNGEIIPPMEFIPLFEKNGFVCEIDFYVLRTVCANIKRWINEGIKPVTVSVNFSKRHLANPHYVEQVLEVIKGSGINPKYIEIEFTETSYFDNYSTFCSVIDTLKQNGIATSMDDFGTGFSSLNMLKDISFDMLKLDKSFLEGDDITERERIVIRNVIRMAQELKIKTISEGVETPEQAKFLKGIECNMAQGFLFDRPLPVKEFEERLRKGKYDAPEIKKFE